MKSARRTRILIPAILITLAATGVLLKSRSDAQERNGGAGMTISGAHGRTIHATGAHSTFSDVDGQAIILIGDHSSLRKMKLNNLAEAVGITQQNLPVLKTGKAKAIRFSTLEAICRHLDCQRGDILEYHPSPSEGEETS